MNGGLRGCAGHLRGTGVRVVARAAAGLPVVHRRVQPREGEGRGGASAVAPVCHLNALAAAAGRRRVRL